MTLREQFSLFLLAAHDWSFLGLPRNEMTLSCGLAVDMPWFTTSTIVMLILVLDLLQFVVALGISHGRASNVLEDGRHTLMQVAGAARYAPRSITLFSFQSPGFSRLH